MNYQNALKQCSGYGSHYSLAVVDSNQDLMDLNEYIQNSGGSRKLYQIIIVIFKGILD